MGVLSEAGSGGRSLVSGIPPARDHEDRFQCEQGGPGGRRHRACRSTGLVVPAVGHSGCCADAGVCRGALCIDAQVGFGEPWESGMAHPLGSLSNIAFWLGIPIVAMVWFHKQRWRRNTRTLEPGDWRGPSSASVPAWPLTLGVLAIGLGTERFLEWIPVIPSHLAWFSQVTEHWSVTPVNVAILLSPFLFASLHVLLVISGLLLARRRRLGPICMVAFAVSVVMVTGFDATIRQSWPLGSEQPILACLFCSWTTDKIVQLLELYIRLIAFPVFLLAWFARPKVRRQTGSWC